MEQTSSILRIIFSITVCILYLNINAQNSIPGVLQQPQWFIPIYFEDGNGDKDTVYLGYDENAINSGPIFDTIYENASLVDTNTFNAIIFDGFEGGFTDAGYVYLPPDTLFTTNGTIVNNIVNMQTNITFNKGDYPLKVTCDFSKLYDTALPLPDISPQPRAKLEMQATGAIQNFASFNAPPYENLNFYGMYFPDPIFAFSDFILNYDEYGVSHDFPVSDSILIFGFDSIIENSITIYFRITPHNQKINILPIKEISEAPFEIYPNPVDNKLYFKGNFEQLEYAIYSLDGQLIESNKLNNNNVNMDYYSSGVYFIKLTTNENNYFGKIIKN